MISRSGALGHRLGLDVFEPGDVEPSCEPAGDTSRDGVRVPMAFIPRRSVRTVSLRLSRPATLSGRSSCAPWASEDPFHRLSRGRGAVERLSAVQGEAVGASPMSPPATSGVLRGRFVRATTSTRTLRWTSTPGAQPLASPFGCTRCRCAQPFAFREGVRWPRPSISPSPGRESVSPSMRRGGVSQVTARWPVVLRTQVRALLCNRRPARSSRHCALRSGRCLACLDGLTLLACTGGRSHAPGSQSGWSRHPLRDHDFVLIEEASAALGDGIVVSIERSARLAHGRTCRSRGGAVRSSRARRAKR